MIVNKQKIDDLAHLARLEFNEIDKVSIANDLEKILEFCTKLDEVDTAGIEPLIYLSKEQNVLRDDFAKKGIDKSLTFKNAPLSDSDYFKVPKVITK